VSQLDETDQKIKLAILARALAVRLGLRAILQAIDQVEVVDEAASLDSLEIEISALDILLAADEALDLEALTAASDTLPGILFLSDQPPTVQELVFHPLPAWGILSRDVSAHELEAAIGALKAGLWVGDPILFPQTIATTSFADRAPGVDTLTSRELEVLQGLSQGLANKQIGFALGISEHTVKFHVSSIFTKLGATNRAEAVRIGIQKGWVTL
jgi:DNA-binding NarL/FixJ family response regulator